MAKQQFSFSEWKKENQKLVDEMFSGRLLHDWTSKEIVAYMKQIMDFYSYEPKRDYFTYHDLQYKVGDYFRQIEWVYRTNFTWENVFEFDVAAEKNDKMIMFKVKPSLTEDDVEHAGDYANHVGKKSSARVFIATDLLNFDNIFQGKIKDSLIEGAKNYKLGIFFSNRNQSWIVPSEFLQLLD